MENIINIGSFIKQLTAYLKICVYINKGTSQDIILERCIRLYNKYKTIENALEINQQDEIFVRKCLKRFNLSLKVNPDGTPVDIRDKANQVKIIFLAGHPALSSDTLSDLLSYIGTNKVDVLAGIPLSFILKPGTHQGLLWQYTRSLFYFSQLILSKGRSDEQTNALKQDIFDTSSNLLEEILVKIAELENVAKMDQVLALDNFLNSKLIKTGITKASVGDANKEVKEIFAKKGLGGNNAMTKMIDSISGKLADVDLSNGNIMQCMFGIAQNVADELRGDLAADPDGFQNTLGAITEVFQDAMNESAKNGEEIPSELKGMLGSFMNMNPTNQDANQEELLKMLANISANNGINEEELLKSMMDDNGELDVSKLDAMLNTK